MPGRMAECPEGASGTTTVTQEVTNSPSVCEIFDNNISTPVKCLQQVNNVVVVFEYFRWRRNALLYLIFPSCIVSFLLL